MPAPHPFALAAGLLLAAGGCSGASGGGASAGERPKRTVLIDTYDDAAVGKETARDVEAEIGVLDDPALTAYVEGIGRKLLRGVPRRGFSYQFRVVDQSEPNAFALPGGYIFLSRGLLTAANSEDELANVIGHEISHAALRHAAAQQEIARRGGALASPWTRATNLAAYSRDMERTADRNGQRLAAAAGYDPQGMADFLDTLGQLERLSAGRSRPRSFFDTHPGSRERAAVNAARARELRWRRDPSLGDTRASHLRRIDGVAVGERPEAGVFEGSRFVHPALGFQIRFPDGWRTSNTNRAVGAISPRGDAVIHLMADLPPGDPRAAGEAFVEKTRQDAPVRVKDSGPVQIGSIPAWRMSLQGSGRGGSLAALVTFIPFREATWRVTGVSPALSADRYRGRMLSTARSFRPLSVSAARAVRTTRLRVVQARRGETLARLGERTGNAWDPARTAIQNGLLPNHRFAGGESVKIARVESYRSEP